MEISKRAVAVKEAYKKGYRVVDGVVITPLGYSLVLVGRRYLRFSTKTINGIYPVHVHRLVAYQKYGDKLFEKGIQVRHLDGDRFNNLEHNIALGSQRDNCFDIPKEERIRRAKHASSFLRKS